MSRKDSKGRVLKQGETQRKDGRYCYQYTTANGERKTVYSWTLNRSDKIPAGKKYGKSLRELEDEINKAISEGSDPQDNTTVKAIVSEYFAQKVAGKAENTLALYRTVEKRLEEMSIWNKKISAVGARDARSAITDMLNSNVGYYVVKKAKATLKASFDLAIEYEMIQRNPFMFAMPQNESKNEKRKALTRKEENDFLSFLKSNERWRKLYHIVNLFIHTGLRIGEMLGLTYDEVDFEHSVVHVNHQILYVTGERVTKSRKTELKFSVDSPKTESGVRDIFMDDESAAALKYLISVRRDVKEETIVDGVSGFILITAKGNPLAEADIRRKLRSITHKYNELTNSNLIVSPHVFRHTFCTRMAERGMNPKDLQYLMGHSTTQMTMDVYTHVSKENAIQSMRKVLENADV